MPRPPSARAHRKVLDAALKLFASEGIDATSVDAIAAASGVSKATIYKHWRNKDALCLEALAWLHGLDELTAPESGDHRADMIVVLNRYQRARRPALQKRMLPQFMAYAARNPTFGKAWRARMMQPTRIHLLQILKRAIAEGALPSGLDLDASVALLAGPMMYRHVLAMIGRRLPGNMAEFIVDSFWLAHALDRVSMPGDRTAAGSSRSLR